MPVDVISFNSRLDMKTKFSHIDCYSVHSELPTTAHGLYDFHSARFNPCPGPMDWFWKLRVVSTSLRLKQCDKCSWLDPWQSFWYICTNTLVFTPIY